MLADYLSFLSAKPRIYYALTSICGRSSSLLHESRHNLHHPEHQRLDQHKTWYSVDERSYDG